MDVCVSSLPSTLEYCIVLCNICWTSVSPSRCVNKDDLFSVQNINTVFDTVSGKIAEKATVMLAIIKLLSEFQHGYYHTFS